MADTVAGGGGDFETDAVFREDKEASSAEGAEGVEPEFEVGREGCRSGVEFGDGDSGGQLAIEAGEGRSAGEGGGEGQGSGFGKAGKFCGDAEGLFFEGKFVVPQFDVPRFDMAEQGGVGTGGVDDFDRDGRLGEGRCFCGAPGGNCGSGCKETPAVEMSPGHDAILSGWGTCVYRLTQGGGGPSVLKRYSSFGVPVLSC